MCSSDLKVVPVRVVLAGHMHTQAGPKVVPGRVFLVSQKHIPAEIKVEKDGFAPQDHMVVQVDTPIVLLVPKVSLVGPQGEAVEVDLEDCKTALASRKVILAGPKVVPVRVVLAGHMDNLVGPKVVPGRVVLVG